MVRFEEVAGTLVCSFAGRMDTAKSIEVENDVFDEVQRRALPVEFDLAQVDYVSSAFYRICLKAARATKEMKLTIVNAAPFVKDGFKITGLDKILEIAE